MKMIRHLRKSLVKEFGQLKVLNFLHETMKSPIESPVIQEYLMQADKVRLAARYSAEHQVLHALLGEKLDSFLLPLFPAELTSYQKGKKLGDVFDDLKIFLSQYIKKNPDKRNRVLGVLKFDVKSYGDSIPLHEKSELWSQLKNSDLEQYIPLLKTELRARVENPTNPKIQQTLIRGLSFGLPTSPALMNLYLSSFDRLMIERFPKSFYRRFGDDGLIITEEPQELPVIQSMMNEELTRLELKAHPTKTRAFHWSQSGFKTESRIEFVGRSVNFNGRMFLTKEKQKRIVQDWKKLLWKIKSTDMTYLVPTWDAFVRSAVCEELYSWSNDSDSVKNLSDRLEQLTFKYFEKKNYKSYQSLFAKWHHK